MINEWWLVVCCFVWLTLMIWTNRMNYRQGIWDGAFNHFLPVVKKEMLFYDRCRATKIFEDEGFEPEQKN